MSIPIPAPSTEINIPPSASLSIAITLPATFSSRSRNLKAFRAVQRADGVIVEHPRYLPPSLQTSVSSPITPVSSSRLTFEPQPTTFSHQSTATRCSMLRRAQRAKKRNEEDAVRMCGRGGYNGPQESEKKEL
ncbi:hypothetical protein K491DRAFT_711491 [Lophiostoma macrostomum CBS 122681]|uniref:Uncharacterized protein n=1 Tax=Lophiostoma macrostomum CBS 122681 TaxID=1314788 RepID=A0A6A6TPR9_9PLEO|nr:hypothetical protein K491DRAFT_711491 [Lophiostoma macrostomum CBS 122681]